MEKCKYIGIVPENLPISVGRRIIKRYDVIKCPYARARILCNCGYVNFLDRNSNSIEGIVNTTHKHIRCEVCGEYYNITEDVDIVCLCEECILVNNKNREET